MLRRIIEYQKKNTASVLVRYISAEYLPHVISGGIVNIEYAYFLSSDSSSTIMVASDGLVERGEFCEWLLKLYLGMNSELFDKLHKGTAYYFIAVGEFMKKNVEKFAYLLDLAIIQDNNSMPDSDRKTGSGAEGLLSGQKLISSEGDTYIFDNEVGKLIRTVIDNFISQSPLGITIPYHVFLNQFIFPISRNSRDIFHSLLTSLLSWLYEITDIQTMIELYKPNENSSMDVYYLHLSKGALIFESLCKCLFLRKLPTANVDVPMGTLFCDRTFCAFMKIDVGTVDNQIGGVRINTLVHLLNAIPDIPVTEILYALKICYVVRNTIQHSINWNATVQYVAKNNMLFSAMKESMRHIVLQIVTS